MNLIFCCIKAQISHVYGHRSLQGCEIILLLVPRLQELLIDVSRRWNAAMMSIVKTMNDNMHMVPTNLRPVQI